MTVKINIENRTIIRIMIVVVLFLVALRFFEALARPMTLVFVSAFLAVAINPPVNYLSRKIFKGNRVASTGIAYLIVVAIIGLFLWALVPPMVRESGEFIENMPEYIDQVTEGDHFVGQFIDRYELDQEIEDFGTNITSRIGDADGPLLTGIGRLGTALISIVTVLVLTFFMLVEGPYWMEKFWEFQDPKEIKHRKELVAKMYGAITGYVNGQLLIALLAGSAALIVLLILGIPFPLPLAGIVSLFGLIPLVGATLGAAIVVIAAAFQSVSAAVVLVVFFIVYQQIENNVIQPMIQAKALDLSPLMVLLAVIFGISVGGIFGGFVAIPVAAIIKILILDYTSRSKQLRRSKA